MWIFGYGSLVWRPDFSPVEAHPAYITGFVRRFWQGSTDHRGVPGAPGRVATLVRKPGQTCFGMAYRIEGSAAQRILSKLDVREQGGYEQLQIDIQFADQGHATTRGLVYWANEHNSCYLGPAPMAEMAAQIADSRGPSGANTEYVFKLADALRTMGALDEHLVELESALKAHMAQA